jgi:tRNA 2-thiouridine synthesizing protein A
MDTITNSATPGHDAHKKDHRPDNVGAEQTGGSGHGHRSAEPALPAAQALLEMKAALESHGSTCALLTPAIKSRLKELESGQVLEVRIDDATAREDIAAWCRVSGNELLAMRDGGYQGLRFFVRKK